MRLLVCGSRTWASEVQYHRVAEEIIGLGPALVMHGGAKGADECADLWCRTPPETIPLLVFRAEWERYRSDDKPNPAGPIRNTRMLADGKPDRGLAFGALWKPRSLPPPYKVGWKLTGTGDMVAKMLRVGLPVRWVAAADAPAVDLAEMPGPPRA